MMNSPLCILVDDDEIVRDSWQLDFNLKGKELVSFKNIASFKDWFSQNEINLTKETNFCFDLNIEGEKLSFDGIELAEMVYKKGFKNVHLCSLVSSEEVKPKLTFDINYQQSKEPPREVLL